MELLYYDSPLGCLRLSAGEDGLTELRFQTPPPEHSVGESAILRQTCRWLDAYFAGQVPEERPPLCPKGTDFQQQVWQLLLEIPCGHTVSYGQIAERLAQRQGLGQMAAQAVGAAVSRNPIALLIPCHRVICADGRPGGYAWGLERKLWLLRHEARHGMR